MATNTKLLRANVTLLAAYPEYAADPLAPTSAELNAQFDYGDNLGKMVFNISCAITDDNFTADITDSETDNTRTICDKGQVTNPTFANYDVTFQTLRDRDVTGHGVFNIPFNLFKTPDHKFYIIKRIGKASTEDFAAGDVVTIFGVTTDNASDVSDDKALLQFAPQFKATGELVQNYTLES